MPSCCYYRCTKQNDLWEVPHFKQRSRVYIKKTPSPYCAGLIHGKSRKTKTKDDRELVSIEVGRKWRKKILKSCGYTDDKLRERMDKRQFVCFGHMPPECIEEENGRKVVRYIHGKPEDHCCPIPQSVASTPLRRSPRKRAREQATERLISSPTTPVADVMCLKSHLDALQRENDQLREANRKLKAQLIDYDIIRKENQVLKEKNNELKEVSPWLHWDKVKHLAEIKLKKNDADIVIEFLHIVRCFSS